MDKLLCALGMGMIVFFVKMKSWLDGVVEMVEGADGFALMLGICVVALVVVSVFMLVGRRKIA